MADIVRIAGFCGSLRDGSFTRQALHAALSAAKAAGAETTLFDPAETPLPFCGAEPRGDEAAHLRRWRTVARECDGMILATPEYHGSYSGVIKNALDLVNFDEMEHKVVGLVSVLGGIANQSALNHLRIVCRSVHAWVIPHQAMIGQARAAFDAEGRVKDEKLRRRVERVGEDTVRFARLLRERPELVQSE